MGIRLMVEVLDHAPATLTPRERYALVVLAEDARDETRLCSKGVESNEKVMRRFRVGRSERAAILKALIDKGALERVKRGQKYQHAEFRIPPLAPAQDLEIPDAEQDAAPPQDPETPDAEAVGDAAQDPGFPDPGISQRPGFPLSGSGFSGLRVRETRTPSPQSPQKPSSLSGTARRVADAVGATEAEAREIISIIQRENAPRSLPAYVAALAANGDLAALLDRVREQGPAAAKPSSKHPTIAELRAAQAVTCPHGTPGGDVVCALCRRGAGPVDEAGLRATS